MARLPPIDMAIAAPMPRFAGDVESNRKSRRALQQLAHHDESHDYGYSWGYTVFRTVYTPGSDAAFLNAIKRLAIYARTFTQDEPRAYRPKSEPAFDPRPNAELWSRYYCEVVQDETLANASESEVGERFDTWIRQRRRPATTNAPWRPNGRFLFCLMLDQESIDNILALPEDPYAPAAFSTSSEEGGEGWIKVISNSMRWEEERSSERWWLRVDIEDWLWDVWFLPFDPDAMIGEWGEEDEDGVQHLWGTYHDWHNYEAS